MSQNSNGIKQADSPETWVISLEGGDSLLLRETIFKQADEFCTAKKKYLMPVSKNYSETFYQLTFRCLSSGDPELITDENIDSGQRFHKKLGGYGDVKY